MTTLLDKSIENWHELESHWPADQAGLLRALDQLRQAALALEGAGLELVSRPGVSISLRFGLNPAPPGRERPVFHLIDVAQFDGDLFLSVCFYADEMQDPEELGNLVPLGLFEEDGYCFDQDDEDPELVAYIMKRQQEAHAVASGAGQD